MKLLVFEFATATGVKNPTITMEGQAMLEGLINDFKEFDVEYPINEKKTINFLKKEELKEGKSHPQSIRINENLSSWLNENIRDYDACFPVAPEENLILYELIHIIEDNNVKNIGSTSEAVLRCSDKFETYNFLKNDLPLINTRKVFFNALKEYKDLFKADKKMMIVKPADGISCSGVQLIRSYKDLIKASKLLKRVTKLPYFLLQDYIDGISTSVSLLSNGNESIPLSLNLQNIKLKGAELHYNGGKVPFEHELSEKAKLIAADAVESINGLKGYVGVDLLLDEVKKEVYLLEINPRLTTSYVALRRLLNFNLGEAILESVDGKLPSEIFLNGSMSFYKDKNITFNH
ncbi:MAG: ATP-grasp domain-containing protein [Methanobacterium sp.]|nr:ATP-grasp domain-containing protein [Methanobacterium sp.]